MTATVTAVTITIQGQGIAGIFADIVGVAAAAVALLQVSAAIDGLTTHNGITTDFDILSDLHIVVLIQRVRIQFNQSGLGTAHGGSLGQAVSHIVVTGGGAGQIQCAIRGVGSGIGRSGNHIAVTHIQAAIPQGNATIQAGGIQLATLHIQIAFIDRQTGAVCAGGDDCTAGIPEVTFLHDHAGATVGAAVCHQYATGDGNIASDLNGRHLSTSFVTLGRSSHRAIVHLHGACHIDCRISLTGGSNLITFNGKITCTVDRHAIYRLCRQCIGFVGASANGQIASDQNRIAMFHQIGIAGAFALVLDIQGIGTVQNDRQIRIG